MAQTQQVRASRKVRQARPAKMATEKQEQQRLDQMEQAYEDWIDAMEPGNMYAEAEAERERLAEEEWEASAPQWLKDEREEYYRYLAEEASIEHAKELEQEAR